jgi:hypothetical protein
MASVDLSIRRLGGMAQFEHIARALGWTPPGSTCGPVSLPLVSNSARSLDDMPMVSGCLADSDLAGLQPAMSALSTNDAPSTEGGNNRADRPHPSARGPGCGTLHEP